MSHKTIINKPLNWCDIATVIVITFKLKLSVEME